MRLWSLGGRMGCILMVAVMVPVSGRPLQSTSAAAVEMPLFSQATGQSFGALEMAAAEWVHPRLGPFSVGALRRLVITGPILRLDLDRMSSADMRSIQGQFSVLGETAGRFFRDCQWELRDAQQTVVLRTRSLRQLSPGVFLLLPEGAAATRNGVAFKTEKIWARSTPAGLQLVFLSPHTPPRKVTLKFGFQDEDTAP